MTVVIRIQSPQLIQLFSRRRIQKLPAFPAPASVQVRQASPLTVWAGSVFAVIACLCVAMVASIDASASGHSMLGSVSQSLVERVAPAPVPPMQRPPQVGYPYSSAPPLQSTVSPQPRPALTDLRPAGPCTPVSREAWRAPSNRCF